MKRVAIARVLFVALAIVVWNVVFDRVIVLAGRQYVYAAAAAANAGAPYARMDDWMEPAKIRGLKYATAAAAAILVLGLSAVQLAARRASPAKQ